LLFGHAFSVKPGGSVKSAAVMNSHTVVCFYDDSLLFGCVGR
jgi:hypothetical protein